MDEATANQSRSPVLQPGERAGVAKMVISAFACTVLNESFQEGRRMREMPRSGDNGETHDR